MLGLQTSEKCEVYFTRSVKKVDIVLVLTVPNSVHWFGSYVRQKWTSNVGLHASRKKKLK